jgi:hypothetical protein
MYGRIDSKGNFKLGSGESGVAASGSSLPFRAAQVLMYRGPSMSLIAIKGWFSQVANQIISSGLLDLNEGNPDLEILRNKYLGIGRFLGMSLIHRIPTGLANDPNFAATLLGMGSSASSGANSWAVITEGFRSVIPLSVTDSLKITPETFCKLVNGEPVTAG